MPLPNTANTITKGTLFPHELTAELMNLVKGKSSIAKMSASEPVPFTGKDIFTFSMDNEVNVVGENGAKAAGGATVGSKSIVPVKIEYGARVSDEFMIASEEKKIEILRAFSEGFSAKMARGLDIMAMHGVNPRTGIAVSALAANNLDAAAAAASHVVSYTDGTTNPDAAIESAAAFLDGADYQATGLIGSIKIKGYMAALRDNDGNRLFPELAWGAAPDAINGMPVDFNSTVTYNGDDARAYLGDFGMFRWGIAEEIPLTVIPYGNPDNDADAGDLAGHNQVYLRCEAYIGWAIMDNTAFAAIEA